ncbi:MAG: hypothetical protein ABIA67_00905 [Candidatus Margulisiibacteriota bacterium]
MFILFTFLLKPAFGVEIKAGSYLNDFTILNYQKTKFFVFNPEDFDIKKIHGFNIIPVYKVKKGKIGETVVFTHTFENLGNASERINFEVASVPAGSDVKVKVGSKYVKAVEVPEGATFDFEVLFKPPPLAAKSRTYFIQLLVSSGEKDGDAYIGFDGRLHGGKDEITIIDRIQL